MSRKASILITLLFAFLIGLTLGLTIYQEQRLQELESTVEEVQLYVQEQKFIEKDQQRMIDAREEGIRYQKEHKEQKESDGLNE